MKKVPAETTILTDSQVSTLTKHLRDFLTESFPGIDLSTHDPEASIRMMALSANCKQAREALGVSIKDIAAQLRVPQYRLKAVEGPSMRELKPEYLRAYIDFLGLKDWACHWVAANPGLAKKLEIDDL